MKNKVFGYARVSSKEQNEERQLVAFKEFGIDERDIYIDKQSGKDFNREQYSILKNILRENDLLVVKSIDRLGRNYNMIVDEWKDIVKNIKADIVVIDMPLLDTRNNKDLLGTFISDLVLQILSYVAEQERSFIKQRQKEGISNAMNNGVKFGRPKIEKPHNFDDVVFKWKNKELKSKEAMEILGLKPNSFYNLLKRWKKLLKIEEKWEEKWFWLIFLSIIYIEGEKI